MNLRKRFTEIWRRFAAREQAEVKRIRQHVAARFRLDPNAELSPREKEALTRERRSAGAPKIMQGVHQMMACRFWWLHTALEWKASAAELAIAKQWICSEATVHKVRADYKAFAQQFVADKMAQEAWKTNEGRRLVTQVTEDMFAMMADKFKNFEE